MNISTRLNKRFHKTNYSNNNTTTTQKQTIGTVSDKKTIASKYFKKPEGRQSYITFTGDAANMESRTANLNSMIVNKNANYFMMRVSGDSMIGAGIKNGAFVFVDRKKQAQHNDIVVAKINNELVLKTLQKTDDGISLKPENPKYPTLQIKSDDKFEIWGVVANSIYYNPNGISLNN